VEQHLIHIEVLDTATSQDKKEINRDANRGGWGGIEGGEEERARTNETRE